jgi:4-amino-4-deoxy-L-arabinose transferase-like glycosyltransferase
LGRQVALAAAAIVALLPSHILYASVLATENLFTPLLLASIYLFLRSQQSGSRPALLSAGLLLGLSALTRPIALLMPAAWFLFLLWKRRSLAAALGTAAQLVLVVLLTITPWIVRNAVVMNAFIPTATEGGVSFFTGLNDTADGHYSPYARRLVDELGEGLGEVEKERLAYRLAGDFVRRNPGKVVLLVPLNLFHLFRDDVSGVGWNFKGASRPLPLSLGLGLVAVAQLYYMAVLLLAASSAYYRRRLPPDGWFGLLLATVLYRLAFHTIFVGDDRYHHSIMPIAAIFAAFGLIQLHEHRRRRRRPVAPS